MKYPEMTVEKRASTTAHNLKPPTVEGTKEYKKQLQDTIELCENKDTFFWANEVLVVLNKYSPVDIGEIRVRDLMEEFGFESWKSVCDFVRNDECVEFMVRVAKYCKNKGFAVRKDRGFINGEGFGLYRRYEDRASAVMEKGFDAKWFFKAKRPLEILKENTGVDFSCASNYVHPPHHRYPAGHCIKFYEAIDTALDTWAIPNEERVNLIFAAYVVSMGRSGLLVHLPEDNIAGGALTGLKEFKEWLV